MGTKPLDLDTEAVQLCLGVRLWPMLPEPQPHDIWGTQPHARREVQPHETPN